MKPYPYYETARLGTLRELVDWTSEHNGENTAFIYTVKKLRMEVTYTHFRKDVRTLAKHISSMDSRYGHIALLGENSYMWIVSYFAVTYTGKTVVPLDKDMPKDEVGQRLCDSDSDVILLSDTYKDYSDICEGAGARVLLLSHAKELIEDTKDEDAKDEDTENQFFPKPSPETLASIVFTSGTTGKPKGVMLTHGNFASDLWGSCCLVKLESGGLLLLPLHHTFGLVAGVFAPLMLNKSIYINQSLRNISSDLLTAKPQYIFAVPLLIDTLQRNILSNAKKQNKEKMLRRTIALSNALRKLHIDIRRRLFRSVLDALGGKLSLLISGGAPIEQRNIDFFESIGVRVLNGYGITECSPIVAVNRNGFSVPGSVGPLIPCNRVKIGEDGEILVCGDNVMSGYYKNEEATRECLTDGWFHTGDLGRLDEYGALHITGRKKNLIILSNGENISAEEIESAVISEADYVREVIAYGTPEGIEIECYLDPEIPDAKERINEDIARINRELVVNKRISSVKLRDIEFPKTTTKKIIREKR